MQNDLEENCTYDQDTSLSSYTITVLSSSRKSVGVALPSTSQDLQKALDVLQVSDLLNAAIFHAIISVG